MPNTENAKTDAAKVEPEVIRWRRHLHQHPELSFKEEKTGQFVHDALKSFGGIELSRPAGASVMGRIRGARPGRVLAIRADMDALPIQEDTGLEFSSRNNGVMHACGHDGHTAMLLGTAKVLAARREELAGEVRLLFQHAEELLPGGAEEMVEAGVMDGVDAVIGTHLWSPLACGKIAVTYGPMMAAPDTFWITIKGAGGHASRPHDVIDSIAIASQVVNNLQHLVARNTDPLDSLVVSVTQFHAGTAHNVIPGAAEIMGTVRSFNPALRATVPEMIERVARGVTQAHAAQYEFKYQKGYRPVINHDGVNAVVEEAACELFGEAAIDYEQRNMGGEDFSAFQAQTPGAFFYVGAGNDAKQAVYPHHHPRFAIDEDALVNGVQMFLHASEKLLAAHE
jgi:amidohydrolase